ncbi:MAG: SH3 domain-containing protein, partial [Bdellovibrionota bacterium]
MNRKLLFLFAVLAPTLVLMSQSQVLAAQKATVIVQEAEVRSDANADSDVIYRFAKDTQIEISSDAVKDAEGINWYKVRLEALGKFGFVRSNDVVSGRLAGDVQRAAIDTTSGGYDPKGGWIFVLRAMAIAGWTQRKVAATGQVVDGQDLIAGDLELSVSPFFFLKGYLRRMVSLAGAYQHFQNDRIGLGGLVFRIY